MMERPDDNAIPPDAQFHGNGNGEDASPARELTLHLLRMLETRMDAAGIAIQAEVQIVTQRLQLKLLAGVLAFLAVWGGIVLLAIALPENARIPVLSGVVAAFLVAAVIAFVVAQRKASSYEVGSLRWFLDSLKLDLEVLSRSLARHRAMQAPAPAPGPGPSATPTPPGNGADHDARRPDGIAA